MKKLISLMVFSTLGLAATAGVWISQDSKSVSAKQDQEDDLKRSKKPERINSQVAKQDMWMKAKQVHAQAVFVGLMEGDFKKVEAGANAMYGSGVLEKWIANREFDQMHVYEGQANTFEYSVKELARYAKQEDIEGALESYLSMSRTCVRCHRMLRDVDPAI